MWVIQPLLPAEPDTGANKDTPSTILALRCYLGLGNDDRSQEKLNICLGQAIPSTQ